jgi:hypothetical protein
MFAGRGFDLGAHAARCFLVISPRRLNYRWVKRCFARRDRPRRFSQRLSGAASFSFHKGIYE